MADVLTKYAREDFRQITPSLTFPVVRGEGGEDGRRGGEKG